MVAILKNKRFVCWPNMFADYRDSNWARRKLQLRLALALLKAE
jgi:hypothetical protein